MNIARCWHSAIQLNKYVCVAGGYDEKTVELYDQGTDEWTQKASMNLPRSVFALTKFNDFLYAIGLDASVERYDSWEDRWRNVCEVAG